MSKVTFSSEEDIALLPVPATRFVEYRHSSVKGFGVRVAARNSRTGKVLRTYFVRFPAGSPQDKENIGLVIDTERKKSDPPNPEEIAFEDAWFEVRKRRAKVELEKETPAAAMPTVMEAFDAYMLDRRSEHRAATIRDYQSKMKRLSSLTYGQQDVPVTDRRVDECDSEFWFGIHRRIKEGYGKAMADAVCRIVKFTYARLVDIGKVSVNPVKALNRRGLSKRHKVTKTGVPAADLPEVWQWMHTHAHPAVRDYMLIEIFMGFRDAVLQQFRWENVDMRHRFYLLPAEEVGNKSKQRLEVPFPDYIWEHVILPRWKARQGEFPWVIPSPKRPDGPLKSVKGSLEAMCAMTGIDTSPHAYRKTFGTAAESAVGNTLRVARLLTHNFKAEGDELRVTAGYIIHTLDDFRDDMNKTAQAILARVNQEISKPDPQGFQSIRDKEKEANKRDAIAYRKKRVARNTELFNVRKAAKGVAKSAEE